ncbi:MAG: hypothetical protein KDA91_07645 [Planctomycetaceae bacterium]|nr:hypothetical protein [Planctomycetaceae bacterium]
MPTVSLSHSHTLRLFLVFAAACISLPAAFAQTDSSGADSSGAEPPIAIPLADSSRIAFSPSNQTQGLTFESAPLTLPESSTSGVQFIPPGHGYWIVSTHDLSQSFSRRSGFCPKVIRYDECIGFRHSSLDELLASLSPGLPVSVAAHGSFMDWQSVYTESRCTWKWLQAGRPELPLQFIYFTWPSYRPLGPIVQLDISVLGRRASLNGFYLADLLQRLPPESPVSLIGHSHGTRVVASSLHLMGGGVVEGYSHPCVSCRNRRIRVVFAASAIDHDWLNPDERFGRALCCVECLLNLRNKHDLALKLYPLRKPPFSSRSLGQAGFTEDDREELGYHGRKVRDLDVSRYIRDKHLWPEYYQRPWIASSISNYVYFPEAIPQPVVFQTAASGTAILR